MENKNTAKQVFVERETYEKNGNTYYSYFIKGNVRGREVKIGIAPPDKDRNGYVVLDIVFGDAMAAELVLKPYEIKDEATGKVITGNSYGIKSVDENGEVYECAVKPFKSADKALLNMLLR